MFVLWANVCWAILLLLNYILPLPVQAYSTFSIDTACATQTPGHRVSARPDDGNYILTLNSSTWTTDSSNRTSILVTIEANTSGFKGIMLSAFDTATLQRQGSWTIYDVFSYSLACSNLAIRHFNASVKQTSSILWNPPTVAGVGSILFKASIVRDFVTWYKIESAVLTEVLPPSTPIPLNNPDPPTNVAVKSVIADDELIEIQWRKPAFFGSFNVSGYEIQRANLTVHQFATVATTEGEVIDTRDPFTLYAQIPMQACFDAYAFRVRTLTSNSTLELQSDWSSEATGFYVGSFHESATVCTCSP